MSGRRRVTVRWPDGPHDFVLEGSYEEPAGTHSSTGDEPWVVVHGLVVEPAGVEHRRWRGLYARRTGPAEYTMLPRRV